MRAREGGKETETDRERQRWRQRDRDRETGRDVEMTQKFLSDL